MEKLYKIYIDGSHMDKQHDGRLGVGGLLVDSTKKVPIGELISSFSYPLDRNQIEKSYGTRDCSNPTAELLALLIALGSFENILKNRSNKFIVYADYLGVSKWMNGDWRIKEPYIQKIKKDIDNKITKLNLKGRIAFGWVKGHQEIDLNVDSYWNAQADLLAKGLIMK